MVLLYLCLGIIGITFSAGIIMLATYTDGIIHWKNHYNQKPLIAKIFMSVILTFALALLTTFLLCVYNTTNTIMVNRTVKTCTIDEIHNDKDNHYAVVVNTKDASDKINIDIYLCDIDKLHQGGKIIVTQTEYQSPLHDAGDTYINTTWEPY